MRVVRFLPFLRAFSGMMLFAGGLLPLRLFAQNSTPGIVIGRVMNQTTQAALLGASVTLESDPRVTTFTEDDGTFRLEHVPVGEQTLVADYTGLDTARARVNVAATGIPAPIVVRMSSGVYQMAKFEVSTVREGQAMAISSQRAADNIKNVVATDAFGNVADTNIGNLLVKMPGVAGERDEGDVYVVSMRGMNPNLNAVTVDGTRLSGATTRESSRAFEVDKVSTNSIEAVEIVKAATPDMDGDSIGGSINLKSKSAFDRNGRVFEYAVGTNMYYQRHDYYPSASFVYSDVFGAEWRLGAVLTGSFNRTYGPRAATKASYTNPTFTAPAPMTDFQTSEDDILLDRAGTSLKVDYKLSSAASLFANVMYNNFRDRMAQHKQRLRRQNGTATSPDDMLTILTNGRFDYEMESRVRTVKTLRLQAGGKANWRNYTIDFDASYSPSTGFEKRQDLDLRFNTGMNYLIDRTNRLHWASLTRTGGLDPANYDNGVVDSMNKKDFHAGDTVKGAQLNVRRSLDVGLPAYLKVGARYRGQEKTQDRSQDVWTYVGPDGRAGTVNGRNDDNLNRFRDDGHRYLPLNGRYPDLPAWPDWRAMHRELAVHPELFNYNSATSIQNQFVNDGAATEDIYSGYAQGNVKISRLSILGGVRMENTHVSATGPVTDNKQTDPVKKYSGTATRTSSYTDYFPSLHARYEPWPNTLVRASYSTGIGRANFSDLMPITTIDTATSSITQNNVNLKPQHSTGLDVSIEQYLKPIGLLSVGVFEKRITDYIFSVRSTVPGGSNNGFDGQYEGYDYNTKTNGGWARVKGFEANYSQQYTFLPGWLGGFGSFLNYTRLVTRGTFSGTTVVDKLSGFNPILINGGLSYIRYKLTLRAQLNYTGERVTSFNATPAQMNWQEPRSTVDVSAKYALNSRFGFYFDAFNIFDEKNFIFQGIGTRPTNTQIYGVRISAGITGRF